MLGCWSSGLSPTPSAGAGLSRREGVDAAGEQHQPGEEGGDPHHHRGRVGDQLAQLVAGRKEGDEETIESTQAQSSSEPSWLDHIAAIL